MVANCVVAALPFPALSCATLAATSNVTEPSLVGVTVAVYTDALLADTEPTEALLAVTSLAVNPVTASLKVKVEIKVLLVLVPMISEEITTVGELAS